MRYSRNKIDKAGAVVASPSPIDLIRYAEAITIINDWREQHLPVLIELAREVSATLAENHIKASFSSQRLKRMVSIVEKIKRFPNMDLGGMQDIGGARFVFNDMPTLQQSFAINLYTQIESKITPDIGAVVLVSVSNIQELREAYPSYFLNAEEFIAALNTFSTRCLTNK